MEFNEQAFCEKFKQLDTENEGRLSREDIRSLLNEFDMEQRPGSISNTFEHFFYYSKRYSASSSKYTNPKSIEMEDEQAEEGEQQEQNIDNLVQGYKLSMEEALKYAGFIRQKIKFELWKKTCQILQFQYAINQSSKRSIFPLKDPGQDVKASIIIGKEADSYNSCLTANLKKTPSSPNQPITLTVKIHTGSKQASVKIGNCWKTIYEMINDMLGEERPDAGEFLKTILITTDQADTHFTLRVESNSKELNQLVKTFSELGDNIFKTTLKFNLQFSLDFNFDVGQFISNKDVNLYDFLAQNIRVRFSFKGSEYVTALKELMIANQAFSDLSYVNDDAFSLALIALVNMQSVDLNLRFGNDFLGEKEQESLKAILGVLFQLKEMTKEHEEKMPDVFNLIKEALKHRIDVQARACDFLFDLTLKIRNLDQLIFKTSVILAEQAEPEDDQ